MPRAKTSPQTPTSNRGEGRIGQRVVERRGRPSGFGV